MALLPVNFGATNLTIEFDCRNAFSFDPVLAAKIGDQRCVFANAAPFSDGFGLSDFTDDLRDSVERNPQHASMRDHQKQRHPKVPLFFVIVAGPTQRAENRSDGMQCDAEAREVYLTYTSGSPTKRNEALLATARPYGRFFTCPCRPCRPYHPYRRHRPCRRQLSRLSALQQSWPQS